LSNFAAEAKAYGKPFFLRFAWEMNGVWSPYGEGIDINANCPPGSFTNMWRHVHDLFTRVGCTNATWIWCVDRDITNAWHFGPIRLFYPGDDYLDWVGFDSYNRTSESLQSIFEVTYNSLATLAPGKPIMTETASYPPGGPPPLDSKPAWIADALAQVPVRYPNIKAFMWWNWHDGSINLRDDVTIEGGDNWLPYWLAPVDWTSVNAFSNGIASPYYLDNLFTNLASSPIQPMALLDAPSPPTASASNATVWLSWSGVAGADSYNVYRSTSASLGSFGWLARAPATNWTDTSSTCGTTYFYVVSAENLAGESLGSAPVSITPPRPALRAQLTRTNTVLLLWPASFGDLVLQSSENLHAMNWQTLTAPVTVANGQNLVVVFPQSANQFYRLKLP
ncbi:MAG TPA: glycosyl hydrolase, partial [Candidatus Sulfotelmatobacter sp.]|nr:glycosyl hydrolase [Candidatus Sulfotelmatobacter sp.]